MSSFSRITALACMTTPLVVFLVPGAHAQQPSFAPVEVIDTAPAPGSSLGLDVPAPTGSRLELAPRDTPASVSSISRADMAERSITRAQDAAVRMPGITEAPAPGNGGTRLAARGFLGHNSVAQLVDGTRLTVAVGTLTYPFSTWPLEAVEVLRGPASVLYGDGSIGAAVNYLTKQPLFARSEREAFASVGSFSTVQGGVGLRGPLGEVLAYSLYVDAAHSDGYRRFEDYDRRNWSLALAARPMQGLKVTFSLDGGSNDDARYFGSPLQDGALVPALRRTNFNVQDSVVKYNDRMWRVRTQYQPHEHFTLRNETYHLRANRHWRNSEAATFNAAGTLINRSDYLEIIHNQEQTGSRLDATWNGSLGRFALGLEGYKTKFLHTNNSPYGGASAVDLWHFDPGYFTSPVATTPGRHATLQTVALFAENALDLSAQWKLVTGLRSDHIRFDNHALRTGAQQRLKYSPVTGRVGAVWTASEALSLYGQYGTGTDPVSGAMSLPGGSTEFDLTKGRQVEVGAKGALPAAVAMPGEWTVALYRIEKRNLLSRDPEHPDVVQQIGQQSSTGVEWALAFEPARGWTVDANVTYLRARYDDFHEVVSGTAVSRSGNVPAGVPQRTANLWNTWHIHPAWKAGLGLRHVGRRPANTANTAHLPAYTVMDASLAWTPAAGRSLTLAVHNLGDRDYALTGSGNLRWRLGAPRTVQLTARFMF